MIPFGSGGFSPEDSRAKPYRSELSALRFQLSVQIPNRDGIRAALWRGRSPPIPGESLRDLMGVSVCFPFSILHSPLSALRSPLFAFRFSLTPIAWKVEVAWVQGDSIDEEEVSEIVGRGAPGGG